MALSILPENNYKVARTEIEKAPSRLRDIGWGPIIVASLIVAGGLAAIILFVIPGLLHLK